MPGIDSSRVSRAPGFGNERNNARVYGWDGVAKSCGTLARSTIRLAYITMTSCANCATTPRFMRDQQDRHTHFPLQLFQQLQDLGLNRHVQRRGRLIGNEQVGLARQGHGNHHPLFHAAGHFVRVLIDALVR